MGEFDGKVALVTGGGTGIGRATALAFAKAGARVVIGNRNEEAGHEVAEAIRAAGGEASFQRTDVLQAKDIEALVDHAVERFGRLDAAFNNAGIEGKVAPLVEQTEDAYAAVMDTNVRGVWLAMKFQIAQMLKQGGGAIVNNSSIVGHVSVPGIGLYAASKHAVMGLTKSAALEYSAHGVRVNAVNPAIIETRMADDLIKRTGMPVEKLASLHPIGRIGQPEEVAEAVLWLCSDRSSFVTGSGLLVDGGYVAR